MDRLDPATERYLRKALKSAYQKGRRAERSAMFGGMFAGLNGDGERVLTKALKGVFKADRPAEHADPAPYGYCPECREPGVMAERRPDGTATCANGHEYPRAAAKYASTQIDLTGDVRRKLLARAARVDEADLADDGREDDPHVTVRYGLHAGSPVPVADVVRDFGPVRLALGGLGAFRGAESGQEYDVIFAEVDSPDLHRLNAALAALPHTDTHATYRPHATVAYVKAGLADKYLAELLPVNGDFETSRLVFSTAARDRTDVRMSSAVGKADLFVNKAVAAAFVTKSFNEEDHPRGDDGRFVSGEDLSAAKSDPAKAKELRERVTDPEQRKKLDAAIGTEAETAAPAAGTEAEAPAAGADPSVPVEMPSVAGGGFVSDVARDNLRRAALAEKLHRAGQLLPDEAVEYAGDSRHLTAARAEVLLTNKLGLSPEDAEQALAGLKPATTVTVGGNRKRPAYDTLDLFRAAGKLFENSGNGPTPSGQDSVSGQSDPGSRGAGDGRGQGVLSEVRGGAGERRGAGVVGGGGRDAAGVGDAGRGVVGPAPGGPAAPAGADAGNPGRGVAAAATVSGTGVAGPAAGVPESVAGVGPDVRAGGDRPRVTEGMSPEQVAAHVEAADLDPTRFTPDDLYALARQAPAETGARRRMLAELANHEDSVGRKLAGGGTVHPEVMGHYPHLSKQAASGTTGQGPAPGTDASGPAAAETAPESQTEPSADYSPPSDWVKTEAAGAQVPLKDKTGRPMMIQAYKKTVSRFDGRESVVVDAQQLAPDGANRNRRLMPFLQGLHQAYLNSPGADPNAHAPDSFRDGVEIDAKMADWMGLPHGKQTVETPLSSLVKPKKPAATPPATAAGEPAKKRAARKPAAKKPVDSGGPAGDTPGMDAPASHPWFDTLKSDPLAADRVRRAEAEGNRIRQRLGKPAAKHELVLLPLSAVKPSQTGEDYDNGSSRALAAKVTDYGGSGRAADYNPVVVDEDNNIVDGNHRHAAHTFAGLTHIPALRPVTSAK